MRNSQEVQDLVKQIDVLKQQLAEALRSQPREIVENYVFTDLQGNPVTLRELFGEQRDLIVTHNMGTGCSYCTLWADEQNGIANLLTSRCAFVIASPDDWQTMDKFAAKRGWTLPMVSTAGNTFKKDMGFIPEDGEGTWPGCTSFFLRDDGQIEKVGSAEFGPGDDFCSLWSYFGMLSDGAGDWEPQYRLPR